MTSSLNSDSAFSTSDYPRCPSRPRGSNQVEVIFLDEWLDNFWQGCFPIVGSTVFPLAPSGFMVRASTSILQKEAMLLVQGKQVETVDVVWVQIGRSFAFSFEGKAEPEFLKSIKLLVRTNGVSGPNLPADLVREIPYDE